MQQNDIIVVGSDGLWENLPGNDELRVIQGFHDDDPNALAARLLEAALGAGLKEDDISCAVGIVSPIRDLEPLP